MYLDKVFMKERNTCVVANKKQFFFLFLSKRSLEIEKPCKILLKELYHTADQKTFLSLHLKLSTIFI